MKGDPCEAALRLAASLPCRTHEQRARSPIPQHMKEGYVAPKRTAIGKGGKARPVRIGGVVYESVSAAARTRHMALGRIYAQIRSGESEYV